MLIHRIALTASLTAAVAFAGIGCSSSYKESGEASANAGEVRNEYDALEREAQLAISTFKQQDPTLTKFFDSAYAYAVFPTIGKGGLGIGGAYGKGVVYEQGKVVGYSTMKQGTVGFQIGGQAYSQLIFFQSKAALEEFKRDDAEFSAQVSGVAATAGAARTADWEEGMAVFTHAKGGLMGEASIGGQAFDYLPKSAVNP